MITLMYFRSIYYLRKQMELKVEMKNIKSNAVLSPGGGGGGENGDITRSGYGQSSLTKSSSTSTSSGLTTLEEMRELEKLRKEKIRKKKLDSILVHAKIGASRRETREADELAEARSSLHEMIRQQALETAKVKLLQRVFRGHCARKAARRWALKLGEMNAANRLLTAAAIAIQRTVRGYVGRTIAARKRAAYSHFIMMMQKEESADQKEYFEIMQQLQANAYKQKAAMEKNLGLTKKRPTVDEMFAKIDEVSSCLTYLW